MDIIYNSIVFLLFSDGWDPTPEFWFEEVIRACLEVEVVVL